jgi:hypothetical protein
MNRVNSVIIDAYLKCKWQDPTVFSTAFSAYVLSNCMESRQEQYSNNRAEIRQPEWVAADL